MSVHICLHPLSIPEGMQNLRDFYISPYILGILYATIFKICTPTDPINITQHAKHEQNWIIKNRYKKTWFLRGRHISPMGHAIWVNVQQYRYRCNITDLEIFTFHLWKFIKISNLINIASIFSAWKQESGTKMAN